MLRIAVLLLCVAVIQGATFARRFVPGESRILSDGTVCEGSRRLNDQWQTPGKCNKCTCLQSGQSVCESCGVSVRLQDTTGKFFCYRSATTYPGCCDDVICQGDTRFNFMDFLRSASL
ncbi:uncharacterized protein LOC124285892 [Haliotis rubra]|uniref:uncharacterized protein LOC124285892 n=1 Tax=Haliotis rubra TaxID=36100 RepID=UPI001EE5EB70|nr:uncharacterized protein LOC124285892 [Haliotis rubra]